MPDAGVPDGSPVLKPFGEDIWIADGSDAVVAGFRYPTRMALIKLRDGALFVWSPIELSPKLRTAVDALGRVRHLVEPNSLHHRFLLDWTSAYPSAKTYAPPGLRKKCPEIFFDSDLGDEPAPDWHLEIDQVQVKGNLITTEVVFFHAPSGTVLFTDLIQQLAPASVSGWRGLVAKLDRLTGDEPSVPQKFRIAFIDRHAARRSLQRILAWPAQNVLMAHGKPVDKDAGAFIRRAFGWLNG